MVVQTTTTIPKGWKMTTLGEVATTVTDFVANGSFASLKQNVEYNYKEDFAVMVRLADYNNGFSNLLYTNKKGYDFLKKSSLKPKDIIISNVGEYSGTVFRAPNLEKPMTLAPNSILVRFENDSNDFFYFLLKGKYGQSLIDNIKSGSANPKFNKTDFKKIEVIIPSFPEQRAIAAVLSSLDDKIELLREQNKTLEATAQAIFKEWFINFNFPGATGKMIDSELGEIPEGWRVGKIKDVIDILSGFAFQSSSFSDEGKYKLVTIKNVQDRNFVFDKTDKISEIPDKMPDYCQLASGDILLSLTGNVGRVCLVIGNDFLLNQRVAKLKPKNISDYAFSYLLFLQDSIFFLLQSTASGTAQQNLSPIQTKEIEIVIPSREVLDRFGLLANPMVGKINENNSQIQTLSALRDTLLPKLMKGEVRVKGFK